MRDPPPLQAAENTVLRSIDQQLIENGDVQEEICANTVGWQTLLPFSSAFFLAHPYYKGWGSWIFSQPSMQLKVAMWVPDSEKGEVRWGFLKKLVLS